MYALYFTLAIVNTRTELQYAINCYLYTMIRINQDTTSQLLQEVKKGDLVTDTFSKTGLVEEIDVTDDGMYRIYTYTLVTGRTIVIKK